LADNRTGCLFLIWLSAQQAKRQKGVEYFAQKKSIFEQIIFILKKVPHIENISLH
jgi:DNA mismatch repair ATPase MutS